MNPLVMLYGHDSILLWTRRMLLEQAQFEVRTATEPAELYRTLSSSSIRLLVLCHSVLEQEREIIRSAVLASHPTLKILVLTTSDIHSLIQDQVANTFYGPKTFLAAVHLLADTPTHVPLAQTSSPQA